MPRRLQEIPRIRFVGDESLYWGSDASRGTRTWVFHHPIDSRDIFVGADIAIMRNHPLHHDNLESSFSFPSGHSSRLRPVLLEGKVLGIRRVKNGVVTFTVTDELSGGLTAVSVPASRTTISPDGGWHMKARPIWEQTGPVLRYPMRVWPHDLQRPAEHRRQFTRPNSPTFARNT